MFNTNKVTNIIYGFLIIFISSNLLVFNAFSTCIPHDLKAFYFLYPIPDDSSQRVEIKGIVKNNFMESVDSVEIRVKLKSFSATDYTDHEGKFKLIIPKNVIEEDSLKLTFFRYDYYLLDTTMLINQIGQTNITIILNPRHKILLKGRLFSGNTPVENVDVTVRHIDEIMKFKTLGCYFDEENYYNCLYLGMFKTEIVTDNPEDSIYLSFSKIGYKPQSYQLKFADYSGDIFKFKMKYADSIPNLPSNNINLKISNPFGGSWGWFLGLSFYSKLNYDLLNRLRPGLELSMLTLNRSNTLNTLPGAADTKFDTIYTSYFVGPSFLFFLTKPHVRRFSTYIGSTFSLAFNGGDFVYQPFIGTRFFIDMSKSFSFDLRYLSYNLDVKQYSFIYNGNAISSKKEISINKILFNVGIQINF